MTRRRLRSWSERIFALLLYVHPTDFRTRFGDDMVEYFRDRIADERSKGGRMAVARLWVRVVLDLIAVAAREHVSLRPPPRTSYRTDSMLRNVAQDLRFAGRMLRKSPVLTSVAIIIIALGTGAVSTIFSVANALVLRPIPAVRDVSDIAMIQRTRSPGGTISASYPYYEHLAANSRTMSGVSAWSLVELTVSRGDAGVTALGNIVSGNYFDVLGVRPALGRFFAGDETRVPDSYPVAVISHGFWQRELNGDSAVVGRSIFVNGSNFTVIGVTPARFAGVFPVMRTDVWVPMMMQRRLRPGADFTSAGSAWLELFGRIAPGSSRAEAEREIAALTKQFATAPDAHEPAFLKPFTSARLAAATGLPPDIATPVIGFFGVLLVIAGLVLAIASVNVASMLLARGIARRREIAVRLAIGAGRGRLIRQLLTESLLLFALGGVAGTAVALGGTRLLERIELPVEFPLSIDLAPDARTLAFTLAVALLTGVAFGLAPALQASRLDLSSGLRGDAGNAGARRSRLRNTLIVGQVAISLLLLSASGLFVRALDRGRRVDPGFDVNNVATAALNVRTAGYDEARGRAFYDALRTKLAASPGVMAVGFARLLPLTMNTSGFDIAIDDYSPAGQPMGATFPVLADDVDEGYFAATRLTLLSGRFIRHTDGRGAPRVAVVNQAFARRYWPNREPLGRTFRLEGDVVTVVGIVRDTKFKNLSETPSPFVFLPLAQHWSPGVTVLVRTAGDPVAIAPSIRAAIQSLDPRFPAPAITTLKQSASVSLLPQRFAVAVTAVLGLAGLLLAAVGLYGVLAFSAAQRTREIGIRLALGAKQRDILRLVVGEGLRLVGIGMFVGLLLAALGTRALAPFLFGVSPLDPLTFAAITATLGGAAWLASYLPARRAASLDPSASLRHG